MTTSTEGLGWKLLDPPLSIYEKVSFYPKQLFIITATLYHGIKAIFRNRKITEKTLLRNMFPGFLRANSILTFRQKRWASAPTGKTIAETCKSKGFVHEVKALDFGAKLHWVGEHDSVIKNVILYMHGGGFTGAIHPGHVTMMEKCRMKAEKGTGQRWSLAFVEYDLAPEGKHPRQLQQAAECLSYLLKQGYKPSNIIIGGDSAGGNLALALLSHLAHPHPSVPRITITSPLAGALLISPWVTFAGTTASYCNNVTKDYLSHDLLSISADWYCAAADRDNYTVPLDASAAWWKPLNDLVRKVLIVVGGSEMFLDDNVALGEKMRETLGEKVTIRVTGREVHVACVADDTLGLEPVKGNMTMVIWEWLENIF